MRPFRAACGLLALTAIATQLAVHIRLGFDVVNFFSYFTNLSPRIRLGWHWETGVENTRAACNRFVTDVTGSGS